MNHRDKIRKRQELLQEVGSLLKTTENQMELVETTLWNQSDVDMYVNFWDKAQQLEVLLAEVGFNQIVKVLGEEKKGCTEKGRNDEEEDYAWRATKELTKEERWLREQQVERSDGWYNFPDEERMKLECPKGIMFEMKLRGDRVQKKAFFVAGIRPVLKKVGLEAWRVMNKKCKHKFEHGTLKNEGFDLSKHWEESLRWLWEEIVVFQNVRCQEDHELDVDFDFVDFSEAFCLCEKLHFDVKYLLMSQEDWRSRFEAKPEKALVQRGPGPGEMVAEHVDDQGGSEEQQDGAEKAREVEGYGVVEDKEVKRKVRASKVKKGLGARTGKEERRGTRVKNDKESHREMMAALRQLRVKGKSEIRGTEGSRNESGRENGM